MAKRELYRITVSNWTKHNAHARKGHKATLISNNFCDDAKIRSLPMTSRWLFLNLVITCSNQCRDTVELSSKTIRDMLECNRNIVRVLNELQSLQLVSYEKNDVLYNRIEKKGKERKGKEVVVKPAGSVAAIAPTTDEISGTPVSRVIGKYCEEFKSRYKTNPEIVKSDSGRLKNLVGDLGEKKTIYLITAYFAMPDAWVVKTRHSIAVFVTKINEIKVFAETGNFVSMSEVRDADKNVRGIQEQVAVLNDPDFKNRFDDQKKIAGGA